MKLSEEVARDQFDIFLDYYDIDIDGHKEDTRAMLMMSVRKIVRAIRRGKLEISLDQEGDVVVQQNLKQDKITYAVISGRHKVAMKAKSDTDNYGKLYALMGSLSGLGEKAITDLRGADLGVVECLGAFYLQV